MYWHNIHWIFWRELRDQLRDRRTMLTIMVLPLVLYPLLGLTMLQVSQFGRETPSRVLVLGAAELPPEPAMFRAQAFADELCPAAEARLLHLQVRHDWPVGVAPGESLTNWATESLQTGAYDAVVGFPAGFSQRLAELRAAKSSDQAWPVSAVPEPSVFVNSAKRRSQTAGDRLERVLRRWREKVVEANLQRNDVPAAAVQPFQVASTDVAREPSRRAALWSAILPFVVLVWALTGAFYPAVDLCAGEKERGTLETLLCSPADRREIVLGKLLTVTVFSIATAVLNLASMGVMGSIVLSRMSQISGGALRLGPPPLSAVFWLLVLLVPLATFFSALALAIAAYARSTKEGQYYLMPLLLIMLPLLMLPMLPSVELNLGTSLIPVTGMMLLLRALIEGELLSAALHALPTLAITLACCWLSIRWAVHQFNDESVLFRESERWNLWGWLRHLLRDRREFPSAAMAVGCGLLLLMIRFCVMFWMPEPTDWASLARTTALSLLAFIAAPALLMAVMLTTSPRRTLLLNWPRWSALPLAVLLAVAIHPVGAALGQLVSWLYPFSDDMAQQALALSTLLQAADSILAVVLVFALAPAVCEELAFRGFILSGLRQSGRAGAAIVVSSLFFGAAHGIFQQSITAFAIGLVIGYLAVQSNSLLPGILFHLTYNALSLITALRMPDWLERYPWLTQYIYHDAQTLNETSRIYQWPVTILAALASGVILLRLRRLNEPRRDRSELIAGDALGRPALAMTAKP